MSPISFRFRSESRDDPAGREQQDRGDRRQCARDAPAGRRLRRTAKGGAHEAIAGALERIARILGGIFSSDWKTTCGRPTAVHHDASGIVLKLRGFVLRDESETRYFNVIVERGELRAVRRRRFAARYGLSATDVELLAGLAANESTLCTANRLSVTRATLRTYLCRLGDKLEFETIAELRAFATPLTL